jgi:diguanylate cyclase (GGDEF)-like protein
MRSVMAEFSTNAARITSRVVGASARHRFALAGCAIAIGSGAVAPSFARWSGLPAEIALVIVLASALVVIGWVVGRRVDKLTECSLEDPMTRVGNRRHFEERLSEEVERAVGSSMPLSVLMLDVDNLKTLNDKHGHAIGDKALAIVGEVLLETCRSRDVPARFGGDEFAVLLPRTRASEARVVAERIRLALAKRRNQVGAPLAKLLTVSIGISDLENVRQPTPDLLFESADQALYAAKEAGRDRIEVKQTPCISGIICLDEHRAKKKARGAQGA